VSTVASRLSYGLIAVVAFICFDVLGFWVVRNGEPRALLAWEHSLLDRSTLIAWWLTWACYGKALIPVGVILLLIAWRVPAWRARILFTVVMLLLCWRGADLFQHLFARPRPLDWVVKHETAFSYPSSHAAIAAGFYGLWACILYRSELPRVWRSLLPTLLLILAIAVCWSRLALGAHYFTDLVGGVLLAVAIVAFALAVVPVRLFEPLAGRLRTAAE
jgi:membrane-associated phospholipid phosphatase